MDRRAWFPLFAAALVAIDKMDKIGWDGVLEPGMVLTVEAYVGPRAGGEGVKLEEQVLVTERGPDRLSNAVFDLV